MVSSEKEHKKFKFPKKVLIAIGVVFVLLLVGLSVYFYLEYRKNQELMKNPTLAAQIEVQTLVAKVGQHLDLPTNEQPTIATVSDIGKLAGQPFFAKAKNGFKVLIYAEAQKAILYDIQNDKVIEITSLIAQPTSASVVLSQPVKIVLLNGTATVGLATTVEKRLKDKGASIEVIKKANASKITYEKTIVTDLTGKNSLLVASLAKLLAGEVGSLPQGEDRPEGAEIVVILGQ